VTGRFKAPFLWQPCDHDRVVRFSGLPTTRFNSHPWRIRCWFLG